MEKKLKVLKLEGYFKRGIRHQIWLEEPVSASRRGVDMLLKKIANEEYVSELPILKRNQFLSPLRLKIYQKQRLLFKIQEV